MKIGIDKIIIPPDRNRRDGDDGALALLAASIRDVGLLHPPVVSPDFQLIAGGRRLAAIRRLGWTEVEVTVARNLTDALACLTAERDENECRLDLLPSEAVELGRRLEEMEREAAARRRAATQAAGRDKSGNPVFFGSGNFPAPKNTSQQPDDEQLSEEGSQQPETAPSSPPIPRVLPAWMTRRGETRDRVGAAVGMSGKTFEKAKAVVEAAEENPAAFAPVVAEMDRTGKVDPAYKKVVAHVGHNSGDNEWYTPKPLVEAAREVIGSFDLDPASSEKANEVVKASAFFTAQDDGLSKPWGGRVWMNPPYAQPLVSQFAEKLVEHVINGDITEAVVLVNNATETRWFHCLFGVASAVCFPAGRVRFWKPGEQHAAPLQGQAILYFGERKSTFRDVFREFGKVAYVER